MSAPAASTPAPARAPAPARSSAPVRSPAPSQRAPEAAPIPLTARKAEAPPLEDDVVTDEITAVTAMSAGIAAAIAFDRAERAAPAKAPTSPAPTPTSPVPATSSPAPTPAAPAPAPSRAPVPSFAAEPEPVTARKPSPVARAVARPKPASAPAPEALSDETSPSFPLAAVMAAKPAPPRPHQALRVALARVGGVVTARALGPEGLRDGEVEVMAVGVAPSADLAALFTES
ncbi:MAG: hypothetical protein U0324_43430 [Polyangiales bacterium]